MNTKELNGILKEEIAALLAENNTEDGTSFSIDQYSKPLLSSWSAGVNGNWSKTTAIGKLAHQFVSVKFNGIGCC